MNNLAFSVIMQAEFLQTVSMYFVRIDAYILYVR